ncbi:hypothetical protein BDV96DRAFT_587309 [Lophiotrema nucula]|uniref:Uncharacterized protein n=1 Tax=Lophiotrema nucula TaxID=690887 RepID=A0A6A5YN11_9PLEO|nr:hypothetical protein BDV96DRAFT_587309 [Lophiotrema nucula]
MKPGALPIRPRSRQVCQLCDYILQQPAYRRSFTAASTLKAPAIRRQPPRQNGVLAAVSTRTIATTRKAQRQEPAVVDTAHPEFDKVIDTLRRVEERIQHITTSNKVEPETATLQVLSAIEWIAQQCINIRKGRRPVTVNIRQSSASAILSLAAEDAPVEEKILPRSSSTELPSPSYLSSLAQDLLKHPNVFISPAVLSKYVDVQWDLNNVRAIPEILHLYATKPVPELGSSPPKFSKQNPKGMKQAVPKEIADKALSAGIAAKDMPLCLSIIDTTFCAPAWRRHKIVTKIGPPAAAAVLTPIALYALASELSVYSGYIDPTRFKMYAFAGLFTYVSCTSTLGYVAMTTFNDHMERVVWRPGIPLTERWLREDERAALDRIACAWGFKETWRRGDEEGEEWEALREWIYLRDMILDKSDLLEGMNPSKP